MPQRKDRLGQCNCARRGIGMPNIALDRSEHAAVTSGAVYLCQTRELDRVTDRGTGAMCLHHVHRVGVHPGRRQSRPVHRDLGLLRRRRETLTASVLIGGGAAHHGKDAVTIAQRIRESLEQHHGATLGTHVPVGRDIERPAASRRRKHAPARHRREFARFQHHHAAAGQGEVALAVVQTAAGHVHREQTRRACRVYCQRRPAQPEGVGDPSGSQAGGGAGKPVHLSKGTRVGGDECIVVVGQSDEHTRLGACQRLWRQTCVLHCLPRGFQQQAVLRIERGSLPFADPEEFGIEACYVVEETTPPRHRPIGHTGLGVVVAVGIPPLDGNLADQVLAPQQCFPQQVWRVDAFGEPARHADDSNRSNTFPIYGSSPLLTSASRRHRRNSIRDGNAAASQVDPLPPDIEAKTPMREVNQQRNLSTQHTSENRADVPKI